MSDDGTYRTPREAGLSRLEGGRPPRRLDEKTASERTYPTLKRSGRASGGREGTGPNDDPWLRSPRPENFERGRFRGRAGGGVEGHAEGRAQG